MIAVFTTLLLAGCTADAAPIAAPVVSASASSASSGFGAAEEIATGIDVPWGMAFLPGGDTLITERQTGRVLRIRAGQEPVPVRTVPDVYFPRGDGGLLGLAISPQFDRDNLVYVYYTVAGAIRIGRFPLDSDDPVQVILEFEHGDNHSGGRLKFGPDGMLYATVGNGHDDAAAQDPANLNGKILRITPDGQPAPGNPFPGSAVWSYGHRNLEGIAWDAEGRMYASEFGEDTADEINLIEPGHNYGWPDVEGIGDTGNGRFTNPLVTFPTAEAGPSGIAVSGTTLYVAGLTGQRLITIPLLDGRLGEPAQHLQGVYGRLRTVEVAPDGALWLTTSNRQGRGGPREGDDRIIRFAPAGRG
ncbi:PQQ-dependent sugar dehydrogenase [Paractinoplanes ovalisporus]|nr:PQQ-dependent sugar dehydrogenase [Actinoplanes ovalisporus]